MKRITLVFGLVAVMAAMIVALAAPAMAKDKGDPNNGGINRLENRLDRLDDRLDFDRDIDVDFVSDVDRSPVFISTNNVDSCWLWNGRTWVWACGLGTEVLNGGFVSDIDFDVDVDRNFGRHIDFDRDIDVDFDRDIDFVNVDRDIGFSHGNNHNGSARHNGGGGHNKGHGK